MRAFEKKRGGGGPETFAFRSKKPSVAPSCFCVKGKKKRKKGGERDSWPPAKKLLRQHAGGGNGLGKGGEGTGVVRQEGEGKREKKGRSSDEGKHNPPHPERKTKKGKGIRGRKKNAPQSPSPGLRGRKKKKGGEKKELRCDHKKKKAPISNQEKKGQGEKRRGNPAHRFREGGRKRGDRKIQPCRVKKCAASREENADDGGKSLLGKGKEKGGGRETIPNRSGGRASAPAAGKKGKLIGQRKNDTRESRA